MYTSNYFKHEETLLLATRQMNKAMKSVNSFLAFLQIILTIHHLISPAVATEEGYFPVLLTDSVHYRYFSVVRDQKVVSKAGTKVKRVRVYDDMECVGRCTRMGDSCKSVNYKKKDTDDLHLCELLVKDTYDKLAEPLPQNIYDKAYQHIFVHPPIHKTCVEVYKNNGRRNAVYNIAPIPSLSLYVYCDMTTAGGGWTVIQKRIDGSVDFYRDWDHYKKGFGNKLGEYWLGLDNIHAMTSQRGYKLRIDMEDFEGEKRYAEYEYFTVADESDNYRLTIGGFSGNAGDAMAIHNNMQFSTKDRDNDQWVVNYHHKDCANTYKGAWWYYKCHDTCPNGQYYQSPGLVPMDGLGIIWSKWKTLKESLKRIEMKIRPKDLI